MIQFDGLAYFSAGLKLNHQLNELAMEAYFHPIDPK